MDPHLWRFLQQELARLKTRLASRHPNIYRNLQSNLARYVPEMGGAGD